SWCLSTHSSIPAPRRSLPLPRILTRSANGPESVTTARSSPLWGCTKLKGRAFTASSFGSNKKVVSGPFLITGFSPFSSFIEKTPTGVNRSNTSFLPAHYDLVYLAFGESAVEGQGFIAPRSISRTPLTRSSRHRAG